MPIEASRTFHKELQELHTADINMIAFNLLNVE